MQCALCSAHALVINTVTGCHSEECVCYEQGGTACRAGKQMSVSKLCGKCFCMSESDLDTHFRGWKLSSCWDATLGLVTDEHIAGPHFEKALPRIGLCEDVSVVVGKRKVPGKITRVYLDGDVCEIAVGPDKSLVVHRNDFDFVWGEEVTLGFVNGELYENRCTVCHTPLGPMNPRQLCGKTVCHHNPFVDEWGDPHTVPMTLDYFCTGEVKTFSHKGHHDVQYLFVHKTDIPGLLHRKITFVVDDSYHHRTVVIPPAAAQWTTLTCARKFSALPNHIWRNIFWMAAQDLEGIGHSVLLDGAFGDEKESGYGSDEDSSDSSGASDDSNDAGGAPAFKKQRVHGRPDNE